jgi:hypothetical protein
VAEYKLPEGDRFKDPTKFRVLGTGQGDTLYECWNSAIQLQLRAAYAAGLAAREGWQPIETAPKDGTECIVLTAHGQTTTDTPFVVGVVPPFVIAAVWARGGWWRNNLGYGYTVACHPTHWMPRPPEPK